MKKIVIATHNSAKKNRYKKLLAKFVKNVLDLDDLNIFDKAIENGNSAEENAEIKAKFYAEKSGLPVISEDEALYVDFLPEDKQPGVNVRRINGKEEVNDEQLFTYWEKMISKVPKEKRTGKWHFACCFTTPDSKAKIITFDRFVMFFYPPSKIRIPGWPMSSLQGPIVFKKPHSELTEKEKQKLDQDLVKLISKNISEFLIK